MSIVVMTGAFVNATGNVGTMWGRVPIFTDN